MTTCVTRREALFGITAGVAATAATRATAAEPAKPTAQSSRPRYCLNTSTIRGQKLPLVEVIEIAAKAGYDGIEPWFREIDTHEKQGGSLADLRKRLDDRGLTVESAIGFAAWMADDDTARAAGLETAKRDMDRLRQIGGTRLAAPPAGATRNADFDLNQAAARYRALLDLGDTMGVVPQLEFWGPVASLHRLSQAMYIATESGHPKACLLPDVYHMFRGGSDFAGLKLLAGSAVHCFHMNDYPGNLPAAEQNDGHRVFPGDGAAPLTQILRDLRSNGFRGALSLELFNRDYWNQDPLQVARTGLAKMQDAVAASEA